MLGIPSFGLELLVTTLAIVKCLT